MVAYSCNISCRGCISISDRRRSGVEPYESLVTTIGQWQTKLEPDLVTVFGGEPCLHPDLVDICKVLRAAWPRARLRLITNGYLLDRFDPLSWFDLGLFDLQVSMHRLDHKKKINAILAKIMRTQHPWSVEKLGGERRHQQMAFKHGLLTIYKSVFQEFIVPFQGTPDRIQPWNSDPAKAHAICGAPGTPILYKGRLYKCPAVANTIDLTGENWFDYDGYDVNDDLAEFVRNINRPEPVCGQCPDHTQAIKINHFDKRNVDVKIKYFD